MTSVAGANAFWRSRKASDRISAYIITALIVFVIGLAIHYGTYLVLGEAGTRPAFFDALCRWDCDWYSRIIAHGYGVAPPQGRGVLGQTNWAFFPLYPALIAGLRALTGLPVLMIGFIVSNLAALATAILVAPQFSGHRRGYLVFCVMVLAGPLSFYYSLLYTEALFTLEVAALFVALKRSNYLGAGLVGALMSATRVVGVFAVFAILIQAFMDYRQTGLGWRQIIVSAVQDTKLVLGVLIAPLGLFIYMAYLYVRTGDALGFMHIQRAWGRKIGNPMAQLADALSPLLHARLTMSELVALYVVGLLGLCLGLVAKREIPAAVFCALCILVPLSGGLASMVRFSVVLVPIGVLAANAVAKNALGTYLAIGVLVVMAPLTTEQWLVAAGPLL